MDGSGIWELNIHSGTEMSMDNVRSAMFPWNMVSVPFEEHLDQHVMCIFLWPLSGCF